MTTPTLAPPQIDCAHCDPAPHGLPLPPHPARHTLLTAEGPVRLCTWCSVALVFAADGYGSTLTLTVTAAPSRVALARAGSA